MVSDEIMVRLRQAIRSEIARGASLPGLAARAGINESAASAFFRGGRIGESTAKKWARLLDVSIEEAPPRQAADELWRIAQPWQPDEVLLRLSAAGAEAALLRRGAIVRRFHGATTAAVTEEVRRCATG